MVKETEANKVREKKKKKKEKSLSEVEIHRLASILTKLNEKDLKLLVESFKFPAREGKFLFTCFKCNLKINKL